MNLILRFFLLFLLLWSQPGWATCYPSLDENAPRNLIHEISDEQYAKMKKVISLPKEKQSSPSIYGYAKKDLRDLWELGDMNPILNTVSCGLVLGMWGSLVVPYNSVKSVAKHFLLRPIEKVAAGEIFNQLKDLLRQPDENLEFKKAVLKANSFNMFCGSTPTVLGMSVRSYLSKRNLEEILSSPKSRQEFMDQVNQVESALLYDTTHLPKYPRNTTIKYTLPTDPPQVRFLYEGKKIMKPTDDGSLALAF